MLAGGDIAFIVGKLQAPPFGHSGLTGPALGEMRPERLLQLVSDAFACVAPVVGTRDVSSEDPDRTARRLVDFLRHVKYPAASDDPATVARWRDADVDVVFPALRWVLEHQDRCAKRAHVGHFMADVAVPPEYASDPDVRELLARCHDLQRRFVEAHKEMEATRASSRDPARLRDRVARLEEEREQLNSRVARTDDKIAAKIGDKATVASLTTLAADLRRESNLETELRRQQSEQRDRGDAAERTRRRAAVRLRELRASVNAGSPSALLAQLAEEVDRARVAATETLPAELTARRERLAAIREVMDGGPASDGDLRRAADDVNAAKSRARELEEALAQRRAIRDGDAQLRQQAQVAKTVASKRDAAIARRDALASRRDRVAGEYESSASRAERDESRSASGASAAMSDDDVRAKFDGVKAKLVEYKTLKKTLDALNAESATLARTEAIVDERRRRVAGDVAANERRAGVSGFADAAETLEEVSRRKGALDEEKGAALADISSVIAEITAKINRRKDELQPKVKALRDRRGAFQTLEQKHAERERETKERKETHRVARDALEREVKALRERVFADEAAFHRATIESALDDARVRRAERGVAAKIRDACARRADEAERETRHLAAKREEMKENMGSGMERMDALRDAYRLLDAKARAARRERADETRGVSHAGGANVLRV